MVQMSWAITRMDSLISREVIALERNIYILYMTHAQAVFQSSFTHCPLEDA